MSLIFFFPSIGDYQRSTSKWRLEGGLRNQALPERSQQVIVISDSSSDDHDELEVAGKHSRKLNLIMLLYLLALLMRNYFLE